MKPRSSPSREDVGKEWDRVAGLRAKQLSDGLDISFRSVLFPCIMELAVGTNTSAILDAGCGVGFLTRRLAEAFGGEVVGVDLSAHSIQLARKHNDVQGKVDFVHDSVEAFAERRTVRSFSLVVSNMTLMTTTSLDEFAVAVARLLRPGGHFIFTMTHPFFWPKYWGYESEEWFAYDKEVAIEAPFRISTVERPGPATTHIHRPLERYCSALANAGFCIDSIVEPRPQLEETELRYLSEWRFPRFMGGRARR